MRGALHECSAPWQSFPFPNEPRRSSLFLRGEKELNQEPATASRNKSALKMWGFILPPCLGIWKERIKRSRKYLLGEHILALNYYPCRRLYKYRYIHIYKYVSICVYLSIWMHSYKYTLNDKKKKKDYVTIQRGQNAKLNPFSLVCPGLGKGWSPGTRFFPVHSMPLAYVEPFCVQLRAVCNCSSSKGSEREGEREKSERW